MKSLNKSASLGSPLKRYQGTRIEAVIITKHAAADTPREILTPIARRADTGKYVVYDQTELVQGSNRMVGFTAQDPWIQTTANDPTTTMMVKGEVEYADIERLGVNEALFKADLLASQLSLRGIYVKGVSDFFR